MSDNGIKFGDYILLVNKEAGKAHRRLTAFGSSMDRDDIFQDMCESYCLAKDKWKPEKGVMFSTYLTRTIVNNFNKKARKIGDDVEVHALKLDAVLGVGPKGGTAHEIIPSGDATAEDKAIFNSCRRDVYKQLSPLAAIVLKNVERPSPIIVSEFQACRGQQEFGNENGFSVHMPAVINMSFIMRVMGLSDRIRRDVVMELREMEKVQNATS